MKEVKIAKKREVWIEKVLGKTLPDHGESRETLMKKLLQLDDLNFFYFMTLIEKKGKRQKGQQKGHKNKEKFILFDGRKNTGLPGVAEEEGILVYPTAVAPAELLKELPAISFTDLENRSEEYLPLARSCSIWYRPMQAGTGSSIERSLYLQSLSHQDEEISPSIGAKGTDLYLQITHQGKAIVANLAEVQILRSLKKATAGVFHKIYFEDIVSEETIKAVEQIWHKPFPLNPSQTYEEWTKRGGRVERFGGTMQSHLPTLTSEGLLSLNRVGPGGHGLFAVDVLRRAYLPEQRPKEKGPLIAILGNGEDLGCRPDPLMMGWMLKNKIPIVMVTTEKTGIDLKGGQVALVKDPISSLVYLKIIEEAEAIEMDQQKLFRELGLRQGDSMAYFNTNMALFNYDELTPRMEALVKEVGEEELLQALAPNLIENWKEQKDPDGVIRKYLQLEGAMGSVLLNLDQFWRRLYKVPLVYFINIPKAKRTQFFSPIKSSFDFLMQFHSDRFKFQDEELELFNHRPGHLPSVSLQHPYYKEVKNVLDSFQETGLYHLDFLSVEGKVNFSGTDLKGSILVQSLRDEIVHLREIPQLMALKKANKLTLENIQVKIGNNWQIEIKGL